MAESPREVLERWFVTLWRHRDASAIAAMRGDGSTSRGLTQAPIVGVDAFRVFYERAGALLTDTDVRFDAFVEQGDTVAGLITLTGRVRGRPVHLQGAIFGRIVDGRMVEAKNLFDVAGFMKQLGHDVPADLSEAFTLLEAEA
jgi:hypothetical protein